MRQLRNFSAAAQNNKSDKEFVNEAISKYGGLGEDELINALLENVAKSKQAGTYNPEQMTAFVQTVSPFINKEQREKLNNVIKLISADDE